MTVPLLLSTVSLAIFLSGPMVSRLGSGPRVRGLRISLAGVALSSLFAVVTLVALKCCWSWQSALALALAAIPPLIVFPGLIASQRVPPINDVSTDVDDPPLFTHAAVLPENAGRDLSFPEANRARVRSGYPDLSPLALPGAVDDVFDRARRVAQAMPGWAISAANPGKHTLEASVESSVYRFVDDIVIRVRAAETGAVVDMRSKSREGRSDLGVNAARIRAYFANLRAAS